MKRIVLLVMLIAFAACFAGCAKKDTEAPDSLGAVSMETLTAAVNTTKALPSAQSKAAPPGQQAQRGAALQQKSRHSRHKGLINQRQGKYKLL